MRIVNILFGLLVVAQLSAQSYAFGLKGGLSVGNQRWNEGERNLLYKYHGAAFIETVPTTGNLSIFAQLGYHIRGSAIRTRPYRWINPNTFTLLELPATLTEFQFKNIALTLGSKQKGILNLKNAYYMLGIRGEYTIGTALGNPEFSSYYVQYPVEGNVRKFNYGVYLGGGWEFPFSELIGGLIELSVSPDISRQYFSPELKNILIRNELDERNGQTLTLPAQSIRNITIELTLGIRFLRKIVYID